MAEKNRQKDQSGKISWRLKPQKKLTQNYEMFNCVFPIVNARDSWKMSWVKTLKGQGHSLITFLKSRHDFVFFVNLPKNGPKVQNTKTGKKNKGKITFYDFFLGQEWRFNSLHRVGCLSCWEGEMPAERCVRLKRLVCLYLSKIKYIDPQNILRMSICQDIPKILIWKE